MKKIAIVASMVLGLTATSLAQKPSVVTDNQPGWRKIGETTASFKEQNESIVVLGADEFAAIKLKVTDAPIQIDRVQVFYESGQMEEVNVNNKLQAGSETGMIELKHSDRDISKVAFTYKTLPNTKGDRAKVELMGFKGENHDSEAYRKADDAERDVERAAERTEDDIEREAKEAEEDVERATERAADDAERAAENAEEEIEEEADEAEREAKREARKAEREAEREADKADKTISETAGNIGAGIKDKVYEGKMGPDGQTIYIDKYSKYYYINAEGKKVFVTKSQLKTKVDN